jgi:hypothetical protein
MTVVLALFAAGKRKHAAFEHGSVMRTGLWGG